MNYEIGDKFWSLEGGKVVQLPVTAVLVLSDGVYYNFLVHSVRAGFDYGTELENFSHSNYTKYAWKKEGDLFLTKEDLIKSL